MVINSAVDQLGNDLSPGDLIVPQKVTFTFSAQANETTQIRNDSPDYKFECAVDDASFSACSSPMTYTMDVGKHNFVVRLAS